jgi:thymidylate synthase (FAD)
MRLILEPSVYLVGKQQVCDDELERFLADEGVSQWSTDTEEAGEKLVEVAGRCCYMSFARPRPGGNSAYIDHILEVGHGSVLEHAVFSLVIAGVSRSFTHELVRHRAGFGYSQLSQRFVDESGTEFVVPEALASEVKDARATMEAYGVSAEALIREGRCTGHCTAGLVWIDAVKKTRESYSYLSNYLDEKFSSIEEKTLRRKKARESSRSVLPNATETKIFVTGNARALRHFIEMRGDAAADAEIRKVAIAVLRVLQSESPNLFGDYEIVPLEGGGGAVSTKNRKV